MLEEMRLQGLGVIEEAVLELDPGLTVVTGETGAGKTMVVTGLSLLLGGRADPGLVRPGAKRAVVEGLLRVEPTGRLAARAADAGAELDDDGLIVMRTIGSEGRSRAYAGGAGVPASLLAELAEDLVAVHGQSDQIRLLRPARQRELLDRYAGEPVAKLLGAYRETFARSNAVREELTELVARARERAQEADVLRFGLEEIAAVDPQPGEDEALVAEESRLAHVDGLRAAAEQAHLAMVGDEDPALEAANALTLLATARRGLDGVREHDKELAALADRLGEAAALVADAGADLSSYLSGIDTDPARLAAIGERRAALGGLTRKYGETVDAVLGWARDAAKRLADLDGSDDRIDELRAEDVRLSAELTDLATGLSAARSAAAAQLGTAATAEVAALAMPHARITVAVTQRELEPTGTDPAPGPPNEPAGLTIAGRRVAHGAYGVDEVEFLLRPHPGAPDRPLQRGASGGELSRVMLAVELTTSGSGRGSGRGSGPAVGAEGPPTFVFDEVDAGVGGRAAVEVGRRLARLARTAQVVVVTHLPQVAAFADRHYAVRKASDGSVTRSGVVRLDETPRVEELARMLAGHEESASARAHAEELLAQAAEARTEARTEARAGTAAEARTGTRAGSAAEAAGEARTAAGNARSDATGRAGEKAGTAAKRPRTRRPNS